MGLHDVICAANTYNNQRWKLARNKECHRLPPLQPTPPCQRRSRVTYQLIWYTLLTYLDRPLERARSQKRQEHPDRQRCTERPMRIQPVVTNGDSATRAFSGSREESHTTRI